MLLIAALRTVLLLFLIAERTDGRIGTVLTEPLAHLVHLVAHTFVAGIRQCHIDVVGHHALFFFFFFSSEELGESISQKHQWQENHQRQDILRLLEIDFLHSCLFLNCSYSPSFSQSFPAACT